jgi:hypothetical protein
MIDQPGQTFTAMIPQRRWWLWATPLLLLILGFAVMTLVNLPYAQELAREQTELRLADLPAAQAEAARAVMDVSLSTPVLLATSLGVGSVALVIGLLAQAVFLYFGALIAGGDDMDFAGVFTISAWTRLPIALSLLVQAGFIAAAGRAIRYPGLSFLVATGDLMQDAKNPLVPLLARIDPFWVWHLVLVGIGLAVVARFGRGKSALLTVLYGLLTLLFTALPTLLFSGMM